MAIANILLFKMVDSRQPRQLPLARKAGWGGRREGAGRKRKDGQQRPPGVPHVRRPPLAARNPVHVTLKVRREVWSLRRRRSVQALKQAFLGIRNMHAQSASGGLRVVHFAILSNHLHLIVEAADRVALSRGLQSLEIRMARALNASMERDGAVFADRFHAHILKTPTEVGRARRYVLQNSAIHAARAGSPAAAADALTSETMDCTLPPATWLLSTGWTLERRSG